ncbi:MAG: glycosyltransferase [Acetobacteraceae bacterium]|nr:glycosyltransferase [Acetobacteraceae bacterium]
MPDDLRARCAIAVMAKAPKPGRVKTRLCPPLLAEEAMALSAAFLRDVTENIREAARAAPIDGWVAYAPAGDAHAFDGHLAPGTRLLLADGGIEAPAAVQGFGRSLLHAMRDLLARGYGGAAVLNADSPTLPTARLVETAQALLEGGDRAVFGAAEDGGYYLLGLRQAHSRPFEDVAWSTDVVADQTRARVAELGLPMLELAPWYDVDNAAALARLLRELADPTPTADAPYRAASTAACVARLGLPVRLQAAA